MCGSSPLTRGTLREMFGRPITVGSSPLTRGTQAPLLRAGYHRGSSPLTRGTRLLSLLPRARLAVHPRLRGELKLSLVESVRRTRFIPAYAGNSPMPIGSGAVSAVHPRLRGELSLLLIKKIDRNGSSPLTRGTHQLRPRSKRNRRFIPAYAGNSHASSRLSSLNSVHPRLRGELITFLISENTIVGSSPLTRGTLKLFSREKIYRRFIPAYAGNSSTSHITKGDSSVHPRLRGELT